MVGPTWPLSPTTAATRHATRKARTGMSYHLRTIAGIRTWRYRSVSAMQMPNSARLAAATVRKVQDTERSRNATMNQAATAPVTLTTMRLRCASTIKTSENTAVAACAAMLPIALAEMNAESWSRPTNTYAGPAAIGSVATIAPMAAPARSATIAAAMTKPAVTAILRTSESQKIRSGDIRSSVKHYRALSSKRRWPG